MHRYSLSSSSLRPAVPARRLARSFFRAIFFGPRGNICGSCEAVDRRRDSASRTRQVLTFRGSPSPANYACLFLPLLLLSPLLRPPPLRAAVALFPPSASRCLHGFSLTFSRYRPFCTLPFFYPPFRPLASLSPGFDLHHPVVLVPTSYIPWSVLTHSTFPSQLFSFRSYQINVFSISIKLYFQQYLISDN